MNMDALFEQTAVGKRLAKRQPFHHILQVHRWSNERMNPKMCFNLHFTTILQTTEALRVLHGESTCTYNSINTYLICSAVTADVIVKRKFRALTHPEPPTLPGVRDCFLVYCLLQRNMIVFVS
jgi:hypothetical protein